MIEFSFVRNKMTRRISTTESVPPVHTQALFIIFVAFLPRAILFHIYKAYKEQNTNDLDFEGGINF
jgi:hypothetical protein